MARHGHALTGRFRWLIEDDDRDAELAYKRRLLAAVPDVVSGHLAGIAVDSACVELASLVASATGCTLDGDRVVWKEGDDPHCERCSG